MVRAATEEIEFIRLNDDWGAEPNAPVPSVSQLGVYLTLRFKAHVWDGGSGQSAWGLLIFTDCAKWRLGEPNDEGWYLGQCRYSRIAPDWGEFYEIVGGDPVRDQPRDWILPDQPGTGAKHFLFYFRDETFECMAADWKYEGPRKMRGPVGRIVDRVRELLSRQGPRKGRSTGSVRQRRG